MLRFVLSILIVLSVWIAGAAEVSAQRALINGSFEDNAPGFDASGTYALSCGSPRVVTNGSWGAYVAGGDIPGWQTTAQFSAFGCSYSGPVIEFSRKNGGVAQDGDHYIELNSTEPDGVTQKICMQTGETIGYSFWHKSSGTTNGLAETVQMIVGGMLVTTHTATDSWTEVSGTTTYTGATGLVDFRFQSTAPTAASGYQLEGNLLDNVSLTFAPYVQYNTGPFADLETVANPAGPSIIVTGDVPAGGLTVPITVVGGTATVGADFTFESTVSIPAGTYTNAAFAIDFEILADAMSESDETIIFGIGDLGTTGLIADSACSGTGIATATYTIQDVPPEVTAVDDMPAPVNGALGGTLPNVVANDTLGGVANPAINTLVTLTAGTTAQDGTPLGLATAPAAGGIRLDTDTGEIIVDPGTTAGTYIYTYEICEVLNPANCSVAEVTVVTDPQAAVAVDDTPAAVNGALGGTLPNVVANDTLGGVANPAINTLVTLTAGPTAQDGTPLGLATAPAAGGIRLDTDTGEIIVDPGTTAGTYIYTYEICEVLNPANCSVAEVTVVTDPQAAVAVDDTPAAVNGALGGTLPNVVANDTLGGVANPAINTLVTLTAGTTAQDGTPLGLATAPAAGGIRLDTDTGEIIVDPGTTAGTYIYTYEICEVLNPANCSVAEVTVVTDPQAAVAVDDTPAAVNGALGGTLPNVVANDTLGGVANPAINTLVTLTAGTTAQDGTPLGLATAPAAGGIRLDTDTGEIIVDPGTTAGTYIYTYEICEVLNPANCSVAEVTVVTDPQAAVAVDDTPAAVNGALGGTLPNVVANDTLGGVANPAINTLVTLTAGPTAQDGTPLGLATAPAAGGIRLDTDTGEIIVDPGTTAGTYIYTYEICEVLNPANCSVAEVTVVTDPQAAVAVDDTPAAVNGALGGTLPNVVANDTLGGVANPAINTLVTLTAGTTAQDGTPLGLATAPAAGGIRLDTDTGEIIVDPGTTAGTYIYTYEICEVLNPANCSVAEVTVVTDPQAAVAVDDTPAAVNGALGGTLPNVVANDTLGGVANPAINTLVTLTAGPTAQDGTPLGLATAPAAGGIRLDTDTGEIIVDPGTTAGTYIYTYEICEVLNPANCSVAEVTVVTDPQAAVAVDDTPAAVNGALGGTLPNVVANDTLGGVANPAINTLVTLTAGTTAQDGTPLGLATAPAAGGIRLDTDTGEIIVDPGTTAGTYIYTYEICEVLNPANCSVAEVTVTVDAVTIDAVDDTPAAISGAAGATIPYVLANDILDGTAGPVIATQVTVFTSGTAQDGSTSAGLDIVPATGSILFDGASGDITIAPGTSAGTYTYTYEICEVLNPTNCDTAQVRLQINPARIDAVDDDFADAAASSVEDSTVGPVLGNDTLDGSAAPGDGSLISIALVDNDGINGATIAADGTITIPAGTDDGSYALTYEICERLNPTNCDRATVQLRVANPDLLALIKEDLTKVLNEDRAAAMIQQGARMQGYAAGGLQRLKARTATECRDAVNLEAENILFDTDRSVIKPQSAATLDRMAEILATCKGVDFEIAGHTDSDASADYNEGLSQRRVDAVLAALADRGVDTDGFTTTAYGETNPISTNSTAQGKALNRRVEFNLLNQASLVTNCHDGGILQRRIDGDANDTGAQFDGSLYREKYDCVREEWTIVESALSFYESDEGQSQRQLNLSFRREHFSDENSLRGWFFGVYGSQNDISGLAAGEIAGFGLNGGIYGADHLNSGLYLDYYLGAAAGRHTFDLSFDRSIGTIDANGHYTYFAGFAGLAISGDLDFGEVTMTPRAGLELAYSPEAEVEVETSLGELTQYGDFSLSPISGGRAFVELRNEWSLWDGAGFFAFAPRMACYEPFTGDALGCAYGAYIEIERSNPDSPLSYQARLDFERGESFSTGAFTASVLRQLKRGVLRADASLNADGELTLGSSVEVNF